MTTKSLQQMAFPLVISFTMRFLFTVVDMAYAAVLGDDNAAVAAIGLYVPIQNFYIALWVGLSAGFTSCLSNAFGHGDEEQIGRLKRGMACILGALIPVLIGIGIAIHFGIPHLGLEPDLADAFQIYATTLAIGMPITGFWSIYPDSIVKAHQDTKSTMVAGLAASFTNIALNTLFVFAFGWGVFGLAFATVLSRFSGLAYAVHRANRLERERQDKPLEARTMHPFRSPVRAILALSIPGALTYLLIALESGICNKVLAGLPDATTAIASFAVFQQMLQLALMPAAATSVAVVPYLARNLPVGDLPRIRRELRQTTAGILGIAAVATIAMGWVFAAPLANFFLDSEPARAAETSAMALGALQLLPFAALAAAPFLILRPVFEAAQRAVVGIWVTVTRFVLLGPPLVLTGVWAAPHLGLTGLQGVVLGITAAAMASTAIVATLARQVIRPTTATTTP